MTAWTLSAKWASKEIDCTLHGILQGCGAGCCKGFSFWPPRASGTGRCGNLGPEGCRLGDDKPVTCLLYPFRLYGNSLRLHGRAIVGTCRACYKQGGQSILEANRANFTILFGPALVETMIASVRAGLDCTFEPPDWVAAAMAAENKWEAANLTPPGRAEMAAKDPPRRPDHPSLAALRE